MTTRNLSADTVPALYIVGLTGQTGAGKTAVARELEAAGIPVVEADKLAREVVEPGSPCLTALAEAFSPAILRPDGSLDRRKLAELAFAAPETAERLSAITHPAIIALSLERLRGLAAQGVRAAAVDAPLLYESGLDAICSLVAVVTAPARTRLARIMERDGLTEEQARARMAVQPDDAFYLGRGARLLDGGGSLEELQAQARRLAEEVRDKCRERGTSPLGVC